MFPKNIFEEGQSNTVDLFEYAQKVKEPKTAGEPKVFSVSEFTTEIKQALHERFAPGPVWLKGEISNYKGRNQAGHI